MATEGGAAPAPCSSELNLPGDAVAARLISQNAERAEKLRQADSVRQYNLDYNGFGALSAHMEVKASYTAPGTKQFSVISESGSALLRKHVLHKLLESEREAASDAANRDAVALNTANYRFSLLGCAFGDGRPLYVMQVEPLRENKFLYRERSGSMPRISRLLASKPNQRRTLRFGPSGHRSSISIRRLANSTCPRSTKPLPMYGWAERPSSPSTISITTWDGRWRLALDLTDKCLQHAASGEHGQWRRCRNNAPPHAA